MSEDRLTDYISGRLSSVQRARLERAMEGCARCREELESLQQTRALLRALPQEPMPRSFVFAEAPTVAEVYRPARAGGFRMPGWAYAGAAAVAGVAVIVFVLSGTVGTWLPGGSEDGFGGMASTATMEMDQVESIPAHPAAPESVRPAQPTAAPAAPAMEQAMAMASEPSSPASAPIPAEASVERQETGPQVEVAKEIVIEGLAEAEAEPLPTAPPVAAEEPQAAAMAAAPASTVAPASAIAEQEAFLGEPEVRAPVAAAATGPKGIASQADAGGPAPTVGAEADAVRAMPAGGADSSAGEMKETPTVAPMVQSEDLAPPGTEAAGTAATALHPTIAPEDSLATPPPKTKQLASTPEAAMPEPKVTSGAVGQAHATPELPEATASPPGQQVDPTSAVAVIIRPTGMPEPTEPPVRVLERGEAGAADAAAAVGPAGPVGARGAQGPAGAAGLAGAGGDMGPVEPQGDPGSELVQGARAEDGLPVAQETQDSSGAAGASGPVQPLDERTTGPSWDDPVSAGLIGVAAAMVILAVAVILLRSRSAWRRGNRPGTNHEPGTSLVVNRPKLDN